MKDNCKSVIRDNRNYYKNSGKQKYIYLILKNILKLFQNAHVIEMELSGFH